MKTVSADKYQRIRLPDVKGGQKFAYENHGNGFLTLTEVKPVEQPKARPSKVRFVKRGRYTVGESDRPVDMSVIKELLAEFP
jgi:hypothetical protein